MSKTRQCEQDEGWLLVCFVVRRKEKCFIHSTYPNLANDRILSPKSILSTSFQSVSGVFSVPGSGDGGAQGGYSQGKLGA